MQNYHTSTYPRALGGKTVPRGATITIVPSARLALGLILLLALALRLWGVWFGLPYVIQPDEPSVEDRALHMWLAADPNPHYFVYPSLFYDLQALWAFVVAHAAGLFLPGALKYPLLHKPLFYLAGRGLTALMGTLTVLVTYLMGGTLSRRVGLVAALFLAVAAQHVQQSHYITVDAPTALFTGLAALFALRALRGATPGERGPRDVVLAGACAGLAAGTKYNAAVALALPIAAALLQSARPRAWRLRACVAAVAACAVAFAVTTPYAVLDPRPFITSLHVVAQHYATGHVGAEGNDNALWYLRYLAREGLQTPLTVLALAGIPVVLLRYRRSGVALLCFTLPYYALLSSTYVRFDRNLLPLYPFLAVLAAVCAEAAIPPLARVVRNHVAAYALVLGLAVLPTAYTAAYAAAQSDFALSHPFSEQVAVSWADVNLPRHAAIAIENWEGRAFGLSARGYRITALPTLAQWPYAQFRRRGIRYAVADSYTDDAYFSPPRDLVAVARYRELYRRARLLVRIRGGSLLRPGPTMSLYELR